MLKKIREKISNITVEAKSSMAFAISSLISTGMSYLTTPIFTRMLSAEEYGRVVDFLTWQSLFAIVALFSLNYGVFNNGMLDYKEDRDCYCFSLLILSNIITVCVATIVIVFSFFFSDIIEINLTFLVIMFLVFLVQPAYNFWVARQRYEYKYKAALIVATIIAVMAPIVSVLCVMFISGDKAGIRIVSLEVVLLIVYLFFYFYIARKAKWKIKKGYLKEAFIFNLPLIPHYLSTYLLSSSDKLMISKLVGHFATGYYSVAYSIASLGLILWTAINGSLIPFTYEKCKSKEYDGLARLVNKLLLAIGMCCVFVILIAPEILLFLASGDYTESLKVVPVIVGGVFFQVHYSLYANVLYYMRRAKYVMFASFVAALLNIVLNYIFISLFGYMAAGYTTLFCYLVQAIIDYIMMYLMTKQRIYDMRFVGAVSVIVTLMALFGEKLYDFIHIRYGLIGIGIIMLIVICKKYCINSCDKNCEK